MNNSMHGTTFEQLLLAQWDLQTDSYGIDFETMTFDELRGYILRMAYGMEDEIHEATDEVDWKPWVQGEVFNRDAYLGELVDAFHFLMNLILAAGGRPESIATQFVDRYYAKRKINEQRATSGYDGRATKCDVCGREIQDGVPLEERRANGEMFFRCTCGAENCLYMEVT